MVNSQIKVALAAFLFSLSPLFIRRLDLDAYTLLWSSSLIVAVTLTIKTIIQGRTDELTKFDKAIAVLIGLGVFTTINNSLFFSAIKITTVANAMLTHYMAPVFVLIFGVLLIKEKVTKTSALALVLSFIGLVIMISPNEFAFSNVHFLGLVLGTASAVFFALEILSKKVLTRFYKADIINIRYLLIAVVLLIPFVSFDELLAIELAGLASLLIWGVFVIAPGITLLLSGLKEVKTHHASIISYIEPLGAILWGFLIIAELPVIETLVGGALILFGTYLLMKYRNGK